MKLIIDLSATVCPAFNTESCFALVDTQFRGGTVKQRKLEFKQRNSYTDSGNRFLRKRRQQPYETQSPSEQIQADDLP